MTFDPAWNDLHAKRVWGVYPNEHLVRFVMKTKGSFPAPYGALDLGCGAGAQSIFLESAGFVVDAVDGARSAIDRLPRNSRIAAIKADITALDYMNNGFSLVVDVCTLQHLPFDDVKTVIARAHSWLKPGGWFFSFMASHEFDMECEIQPRVTRFVELAELLSGDWKLAVGHENVLRPQGGTVAHWIIEAQKT